MALSKEQIDQLGLDLIYQPGGGGYQEKYYGGYQGVQHEIDAGTVSYLTGLGYTPRTINAAQGSGYSSSGGNTIDSAFLDNAYSQIAAKQATNNQLAEATAANQAAGNYVGAPQVGGENVAQQQSNLQALQAPAGTPGAALQGALQQNPNLTPEQQYQASLQGTATPGATAVDPNQPQTQTNAVQYDPSTGQPIGDATLTGQQVGGRLGTMQFGRVGNDVYEIMSDGSRRKVTEAEFNQKLRAQGLNLDVLPQLDLNNNLGDTPGGMPGTEFNADGTPKGPTDFLSDYKNTIKELGLNDIKAEFEKTKKEYIDLQNKKNEEIADINDNPWLSEGIRVKEVQKINDKYELKENTLSNLQKTYEAMYEEGLAQAKFIATGLQEDRNKMLDLALKREEAEGDLPPGAIGEYVFAVSQGYNGSFIDYQNQDANRKASTTNGLTDAIKSIQLQLLQKELETGKPPTDAQRSLAGFASRIEQTNPIFSTLEKSIVGMNYASFITQLNSPTSYLQSDNIQQYVQASRNFINAVLRRESGAVISPTEFAEARQQYLPQPGDSAGNLAQKKANRDLILNSYSTGSGNAYQSVDSLLGGSNPLGL